MIIVEPFGGLANRMRVIASALTIGKIVNQKVKLIWIANSDLNCEFNELFFPIKDLEVLQSNKQYKYLKATNQNTKIKKLIALLINKSLNIDYCIKEKDFAKYIWSRKINIQEIAATYNNSYYHTCEELNFEKNLDSYSLFKPLTDIQLQIEETCNSFSEDTIGLHIRRTDNIASTKYSPIHLFKEKIEYELTKNPSTLFFLATDDLATEEELINSYGAKIITRKKELTRNTTKGIKDAVVDLFCLSRTKYIYGSYWSSFSDIASRLGNIEFITLKK